MLHTVWKYLFRLNYIQEKLFDSLEKVSLLTIHCLQILKSSITLCGTAASDQKLLITCFGIFKHSKLGIDNTMHFKIPHHELGFHNKAIISSSTELFNITGDNGSVIETHVSPPKNVNLFHCSTSSTTKLHEKSRFVWKHYQFVELYSQKFHSQT